MKKLLKNAYYNSAIGHSIIDPLFKLRHLYRTRIISEKKYLKRNFEKIFGYKLNLKNPGTLNEKIQWLKLYNRTPLHTKCADKFAVREYVMEKIGQEFLIPLIYHTKNPLDIQPGNLPDFPVIIKTTHDSLGTGNIIVKDKSKINWQNVQNHLKKLLLRNFYHATKEWQYKNIEPGIIVEKLLLDRDGCVAKDYKFECINNKVVMINVDQNKEIKHLRNNYSADWELLPVLWPKELKNGEDIVRPIQLSKMIALAETLSEPFCFVRIDFYYLDEKIYFGEMTFHPTGGFGKFEPAVWDEKLGNMLKLPSKNEFS